MKDEFEWCDEFDGFIQPVGETNQFKFKATLRRGLFVFISTNCIGFHTKAFS
ncbi:hypothetical protein [Xenorhabdus bovienii]|uniref:hypothetical protein n=1 Tax=Xenorhabdus bovienii TaxID=40576 RepID=UPI00237C6744|nr:hypothetical protein [Xenorhabdus bovienii]MDE1476540.1 hypothetical protein [Xenorhabdus bovienii]